MGDVRVVRMVLCVAMVVEVELGFTMGSSGLCFKMSVELGFG